MKIISPYHHPRPHLQCCRTRRPFFEGQSAAYAEQILSAASYCHQRGIQWRVFFGGIFGGFFGGFSAPRNIGLVQSRKSYRKRNQWIFAGFCSVNHWNVWTDSIQRSKFVVDMNEPSNIVNLTWLNHQKERVVPCQGPHFYGVFLQREGFNHQQECGLKHPNMRITQQQLL